MPTKQLRFEGPTLEEARRRARDQLGHDIERARLVRSGKERYGGVGGFFQQQRFVIEMELAETAVASNPPATSPASPASLESLLDETTDTVALASFDNDFERELELVIADATAGATTSGVAGGRWLPGEGEPRRRRVSGDGDGLSRALPTDRIVTSTPPGGNASMRSPPRPARRQMRARRPWWLLDFARSTYRRRQTAGTPDSCSPAD